MAKYKGGIPRGNRDGYGLYYHDCRFLDGYELQVAGSRPNTLQEPTTKNSRVPGTFT